MNLKQIKNLIKKFPFDVRVEVIVAQLMETGQDLSKFLIRPRSVFARGFRKDIISAGISEFKDSDKKYINFDVSRNGIYDLLPEGIFHQPKGKKHFRSTQEKIDEIKRQRKEEEDARHFFLPFELELYRQRILLEIEERNTLVGFTNPFQHDWFIKFWGLEGKVSSSQIASLLYMLPIAHKIVGDLRITELCYQTILGEPISMKYVEPVKHDISDYLTPLGTLKLGVDFVIGDELNEGIPAIEIQVGPLKEAMVIDFLPNGKEHKVIEVLNKYFMPISADVVVTVVVQKEERNFQLSEDKYTSRLGFTCNI